MKFVRLFPHYRNGYSFRHGFDLYVWKYAIRFKPPWDGAVFGNGSRWTSGWSNWRICDFHFVENCKRCEQIEKELGRFFNE